VSDPPAETPTGAARALIAWFAGALAFESVHHLSDGSYFTAAGYGLGAVVVAATDYNLKALLAKSPKLSTSLNRIAADARWWVAVAMLSLFVISISPYAEQRRWPFAWQLSTPTPSAEDIAKATGPMRDQLNAVTQQRDAALTDAATLRQQLDAHTTSPNDSPANHHSIAPTSSKCRRYCDKDQRLAKHRGTIE
jgi:hypothetical protein